jgi:hypothetical protein
MSDDSRSVEEFRDLYNRMPPTERWEVFNLVLCDLVRESPHAVAEMRRHLPPGLRAALAPSSEEYAQMTEDLCRQCAEQQEVVVKAIRRHDNRKRGPQTRDKTMKKYEEIARKKQETGWGVKKLAKQFKMSPSGIRKALKQYRQWQIDHPGESHQGRTN